MPEGADRRVRMTLRASLLILLGLVAASCRPCGCSQCQMDGITLALLQANGVPVSSASMHFDYNILPGDDDFSITTTTPAPAGGPPLTETVTGTYHSSGDDFTFTAAPGTSSKILPNAKYTVKCDKKTKRLTFTRPGFAPLSFVCGGG